MSNRKIENGQVYYKIESGNNFKNVDFIRIEKSNFPEPDHYHIRHLRPLGYYFLFRDQWDQEGIVSYEYIKSEYLPMLRFCEHQETVLYSGEDGLTSDVAIYPWPEKLVKLVKNFGNKGKIK